MPRNNKPRRGAPPRLPAGITMTETGRYVARPTSGKRRPRRFDTLEEARTYLRVQELAGNTVADSIKTWMRERPLSVKATTFDRDRQIVRNLPAWFLDMELAEVTFTEVTKVVGSWPGKDATRKRVRTTLQAFFRWAVSKHLIDDSPARDIRIAATSPADKPNPFTWHEVSEIAAEVRPRYPYIADALLLAAHTGIRAGELRALRVGSYRQRPYPHLEIGRSHTETQPDETAPKSGNGRFVPLDPVAIEIVERLSAGRNPEEYLLTTSQGKQVRIRNMKREMGWGTVCQGHKWHDLRHTAAVEWMGITGIKSADVQLLLGHGSLSTTENYLKGFFGTPRHIHISAVFQGIGGAQEPISRHIQDMA